LPVIPPIEMSTSPDHGTEDRTPDPRAEQLRYLRLIEQHTRWTRFIATAFLVAYIVVPLVFATSWTLLWFAGLASMPGQ
jgi:hypothetical protein